MSGKGNPNTTPTITRSKTGATPIKHTIGSNQATFTLNDENIFLWRRALLIRYFKILESSDKMNVQWNDYDQKSKVLETMDEKVPFKNKLPNKELFKSAVSVAINKQKIFVITIFYTTKKATIQGQGTSQWLQTEFKLINDTINTTIEKKQKSSIDKLINELKFKNELLDIEDSDLNVNLNTPVNSPIRPQQQENDTEETYVKSVDIMDKANDSSINPTSSDEIKTLQKEMDKIRSEQSRHKEEATQMKKTLHDLENELVKKDTEIQELNSHYTSLQTDVKQMQSVSQQTATIRDQMTKFEERMWIKLDQKIKELKQDMSDRNETTVRKLKELESHTKQEMSQNMSHLEKNIQEIQCNLKKDHHDASHNQTESRNISVHVPEQESVRKPTDSESVETMYTQHHVQTDRVEINSDSKSEKSTRKETEANTTRPKTRIDYQRRETSNEYDVLIVGSSIIKDIDGRRMYKYKKVKTHTLQDKTVYGATQYIKSCQVKANHIVFQIGSNDIESKTPNEVIEEIENLVTVTKRYYPSATITFGEILPRFYNDRYQAKFYNDHRQIFNVQLYDLCNYFNLQFVKYHFIHPNCFVDGIHIKGKGIPIMVTSIKSVLNKLLNVKIWEKSESNLKLNVNEGNTFVNRNQKSFDQKFNHHSNYFGHERRENVVSGKGKIMNMLEIMLKELRNGQW